MPSSTFRFHPEGRGEFRDAVRWYLARDRRASSDFRIAVSGAIRALAEAPQRWPKYLHGTRRLVVQRFPFSIVYLEDPGLIVIIAVAHSKRKPGYWKDRL